MANPQCEDGYVRIANEIQDALCRTRISGEERQILDCILRKTYGWGKLEDAISLSQFVDMTGIIKTHIPRAINGLLSKKMITITKNGNAPAHIYSFVKDYEQWESLPKKVTLPKLVMKVTKNGNKPLPKMGTTITTIKEKKEKIYSQEAVEYILSKKLLDYILQRNPKHRQPNLNSWAKSIGQLIEINKRTPEEIEEVIDWCQEDSFWQNNILSTETLRRQYDKLFLKMALAPNLNGKKGGSNACL
jgi:phage replication O-like protein O